MHSHRQHSLGVILTNNVLIEMLLDFVIEPVARASKEEQERLVQRVKELLEQQ